VHYLTGWLLSESLQTIYIQVPYYKGQGNETYSVQKNEFIKSLEKQLEIERYARRSDYQCLGAEYCYVKPNGYSLLFYNWTINTSQVYQPKSLFDHRTKEGFCSCLWQELAILSDGRVSFCCVDLTGGTAFTAREEIWKHSLLELWRDDRLINIREKFRNKEVQLKVCQRCLSDLPNHTFYTNDHPFDTVFSPKSKDLFPSNSLGYPRLSSR
jgi:hypothetical protein